MPDPDEIKYKEWEKVLELVRQERIGMEEGARQLIELDPGVARGYEWLARVRLEEGREQEAESLFWKTVEVEPCHPAGYCALANLVNQGNQNVALAARLSWI